MQDSATTAMLEPNTQTEVARVPFVVRAIGTTVVLLTLVVGSFQIVYAGKVLPGVTVDGESVGGLSRAAASAKLKAKIADFSGRTLLVKSGNATVAIPVKALNVDYDVARSLDMAFGYGRAGSLKRQFDEQLRAISGRSTAFAAYTFDDVALQPFLSQASDAVATPVADATLSFNGTAPQINPSSQGRRLDLGQTLQAVDNRLASTSTDTITATSYGLSPAVTTSDLTATAAQANTFLAAPIQLTYGTGTREITQETIAGWVNVHQPPQRDFLVTHKLNDLYQSPTKLTLGLDATAVKDYVAGLADKINQAPTNAVLAMTDNKLMVVKPSQDGLQLDQPAAIAAITTALKQASGPRDLTLKTTGAKADVREDNLASLGITEQLSEGISYFPGSSKDRITNVRAGATKFNGVLLKPGETFSFGKLLGDVNASTGYVPELVILADHEEKQYGGGLCQVSSTAFRAALNAGLPIVERHNHSFAISFYTNPYGVPGVDATIYYPQLDFKFKNDTPGYLLIQTEMEGTTLKFDYYGTKTKSGVIRGPQFISGDADTTKPSKTVFYRDVLDATGAVVKTDTFTTSYESSLKYPVQKEFH